MIDKCAWQWWLSSGSPLQVEVFIHPCQQPGPGIAFLHGHQHQAGPVREVSLGVGVWGQRGNSKSRVVMKRILWADPLHQGALGKHWEIPNSTLRVWPDMGHWRLKPLVLEPFAVHTMRAWPPGIHQPFSHPNVLTFPTDSLRGQF